MNSNGNSRNASVAVFGASGHTGRFVVAELARRGFAPIAIARDAARLASTAFAADGVERRQAAVDDADSLDRALRGAAAVVNCAGPFIDTADAVASAAIRAGIHYLDITAEQTSAATTLARYDAPARAAGVAVVPAMGFYGGLADLLVTTALGDWDGADAIDIATGLDRWHPTPGTRATGARNTAQRLVIADGRLAPLATRASETIWEFPAPIGRQTVIEVPLSEVILIADHVGTDALRHRLGQVGLADLRDPSTPPPVAADDTGRSAQRFAMDAIVRRGGRRRRIVAQGRDIYAFSAPLLCEAAQRLIAGDFRTAGARAPGALFDAHGFLSALAPRDLTFTLTND